MVDSIPRRLLANGTTRPSAIAYYAKSQGAWQPTTWKRFIEEVRTTARALMELGLEKGERVAVLGFNRPEWTIFDHAAMLAGGVPAGIYTTCSAEEVFYILHHSEARAVLVENADQLAKVLSRRDELTSLKAIVMMKGAQAPADRSDVLTWSDLETRAAKVSEAKLDQRVDAIEQADLATLIYTSGTTGPPKAVMLSHGNLAWTASTLIAIDRGGTDDCSLSYLPLSHIAEQMGTIHLPATIGSAVYYAEAPEKVPDNLKEVRPTVFFGVPRIWEKFHTAMNAKLGAVTGVKRALLDRCRKVCLEYHRRRGAGLPIGAGLAFQHRLLTRLVTNKIKLAIGFDRMRHCITGAAPLSSEILEFFTSIDIPIMEVYGQSEGSGPTSFNTPQRTKIGTVGPALPGVEVKIGGDGEVLVRGPNVFMGYLKDPEATNATLEDGWLHSGDLGSVDEQGFLFITGRKKEIIITSGGKNITPRNIEEALKQSALISEAVVIGDRRKFLSVLVTLDENVAKAVCAEPRQGSESDKDALAKQVQQLIDEVNPKLARVEQLKKFTILPAALSVEGGELTPTLKIKRSVVAKKYAKEIDAMYEGADPS